MHIILMVTYLMVSLLIYSLPKRKRQKKLSIWGGLVLFTYGSLRSTFNGTDVIGYANSYLLLPYMSFKEIYNSITTVSRDPFFYSFLKVLSYINKNPQFMLMIISAIVAISISVFIYKNSVNPILSFVMFIGLRYYSFTLSGLRQAIAWSIVMVSYEFLSRKKIKHFVLIVCFASLFHRSALLFLLSYPLSMIRKIDKMTFMVIFLLLFNFTTSDVIVKLIVKIPFLQQYESYIFNGETTNSGSTILFIYFCIVALSFIAKKKIIKKNEDMYLIYNSSLVGVAITSLAFNYANIFRIGYYFILPIILLLPYTIKSLKVDKRTKNLINVLVVTMLAVQFILIGPGAGMDNYIFFWQ